MSYQDTEIVGARELTFEEMEQVNGGILLVLIVIAAGAMLAGCAHTKANRDAACAEDAANGQNAEPGVCS